MKTRKILKIALLVIVAGIFIWTFVFLYQKSQPEVTLYDTVRPAAADLEKTTVVTGKIEPRDEVLIKPQISGIIEEVYKEAGQKVKKGEVIAKVKVIPELGTLNAAESRVRLAEINGRQAETDFARLEKLYADKLISSEEYEKGEVTVKQAREELQAAKDNLQIVKEGITQSSASFSSTLIRSTIEGLILDVPVKVGNSVIMSNTFNDGTTIATVADMNDLIFRGRQAETDFARLEKLYADKLISSEEYEKGEVTVKQAREELQAAKDNLQIVKEGITQSSASFSSTLIRSTIEGLILDVPVKVGNSVIMSNTFNDGTTIATVADMNDLIFRGNIDETEVGRVSEGMPVKITIGALQDLTFQATLEYIAPKSTEDNGANQFEIKAAVSVPDTVVIRSGYSANGEIVLERASQALAIPEGCVEFKDDSTFVYVLTDSVPQQVFRRQPIEVGMSDGIQIAVKSGITDKDLIRNNTKNQEKED